MTLSLDFRAASHGRETGDVVACLITFDHPDFSEPIRLSTDKTQRVRETSQDVIYGTISNNNEFLYFPCLLTLPDNKEDGPGSIVFEFDNVSKEVIPLIRQIEAPMSMDVDMILAKNPNSIERSWPEFEVTSSNYNAGTIEFTATIEALTNEATPGHSYTPSYFPGLFKGL